MKLPTTLAIDTSCDETSVSVVKGVKILSNIQPSQMEYHKKYGGVVPNLARLAHQERINNVVDEAMKVAKVSWNEIDYISVTQGPGLAIALEVGIRKAIELSIMHNKPLFPVNHMEGHLLSCFGLPKNDKEVNIEVNTPGIGILVSGGHTELLYVEKIGKYKKIGQTLDDSCGECIDKCGRMLGLGYPAGPVVSEFAKQHRNNFNFSIEKNNKSTHIIIEHKKDKNRKYQLPIAMARSGDLNFSYSGLKTAFSQLVQELSKAKIDTKITKYERDNKIGNGLDQNMIMDLCVLLEGAAFAPIEMKLEELLKNPEKYIENSEKIKEIWLGGGVIASARLRYLIRRVGNKYGVTTRYPYTKKLTTDNAAMIGLVGNLRIMLGKNFSSFDEIKNSELLPLGIIIQDLEKQELERDPSLSL